MKDENWYVGRSIDEIRKEKSPNATEEQRVGVEIKKSPKMFRSIGLNFPMFNQQCADGFPMVILRLSDTFHNLPEGLPAMRRWLSKGVPRLIRRRTDVIPTVDK